jgi:hypothetical protein
MQAFQTTSLSSWEVFFHWHGFEPINTLELKDMHQIDKKWVFAQGLIERTAF